jgi:hypothetical protein
MHKISADRFQTLSTLRPKFYIYGHNKKGQLIKEQSAEHENRLFDFDINDEYGNMSNKKQGQ